MIAKPVGRSWFAGLAVSSVFTFAVTAGSVPLELTPNCLTSEGRTACGFHCLASSGEVRCSQTANGVCVAGAGTVACWDPPPLLRSVFFLERIPRAHCVISAGQIACGYQCVANYDRVQCAQTPFGACKANEGQLVCWDPPVQVISTYLEATRPAVCVSNYGKVACGYGCVANYGVVRCAKTPEGFCRAERDLVFCWDPPFASIGLVFDATSEQGCLGSTSGSSCGYACLATAHQSRCAVSRDQVCRAKDGDVECGEPNLP